MGPGLERDHKQGRRGGQDCSFRPALAYWERYSNRQEKRLKMGGFMGDITFEGELAEFLPFLRLGEYLHVGKGTVYGLGECEIAGE